jgi:hypothetical protein
MYNDEREMPMRDTGVREVAAGRQSAGVELQQAVESLSKEIEDVKHTAYEIAQLLLGPEKNVREAVPDPSRVPSNDTMGMMAQLTRRAIHQRTMIVDVGNTLRKILNELKA